MCTTPRIRCYCLPACFFLLPYGPSARQYPPYPCTKAANLIPRSNANEGNKQPGGHVRSVALSPVSAIRGNEFANASPGPKDFLKFNLVICSQRGKFYPMFFPIVPTAMRSVCRIGRARPQRKAPDQPSISACAQQFLQQKFLQCKLLHICRESLSASGSREQDESLCQI